MKRAPVTLSIVLTGDEPPTEFRVFAAGKNETTKGTFTFDAAAAKNVMAGYAEHGIDLMLDYDHASLSKPIDPAQGGKAAGWFNLEVRNGELWAVNVRWTPPAAEALRRKEWRFMSPAFETDDSGRVTSLLNVAITNLPATRRLQPLMAAHAVTLGGSMLDAETVKKALAALQEGNADACMALLTDMIASAASGEASTPVEPPAELADPPPAADPEKEKPAEAMAAASRLARLTGKDTIAASVAEVEVWRTSHIELETERQKLAQERATLESAERRRLCASLVTEAGRAPATVWADDTATEPKKYLSAMPIEDFRTFVADAIAANGKPRLPKPPSPQTGANAHGLDEREVKLCAEKKIDPAKYAANRAAIKARSNVNGTGA